MVLDERARHELFLRLQQVLGAAPAETLMELMPPVGWADVATKRDLDALEERLELRFQIMDQRFETMEHKLMAAFRKEMLDRVTTQTRTLIIANLGTVISVAGLAFAAAKLS